MKSQRQGTFTAVVLASIICVLCSCDDSRRSTIIEKKPRPVEVQLLANTTPPTSSFVSAPVASWKTEQIAMEVGGRIEWVVEPNSDIEGRVRDSEGNLIIEGTPIARIDQERYELQVQSAKAQVARADLAIEAATIELEKTLPAQMKAAEAEKKRAKTEHERSKRLVAQNAGAQADVDRDEAAFSTADSQIEQLLANTKGKQAELQSLQAQLLQAKDSLRDAERSVEDCTLYSSFRGQIADVSVVPGSVVSAGQEVATIQMMDPIKVEVEVSASDSRRLRNRQRLPVLVTRENGSIEERDGYLYLVDSVADPQTRTFTLMLLLMNERLTPESAGDSRIAITDLTWRVDFQFLPGAEDGVHYISEDSIYFDDLGPFAWRIENLTVQSRMPKDRLLKVRKMRVELGAAKVPFLGNWVFQQVHILDNDFDPTTGLIAGRISVPDGTPKDWNGDTVLFQNEVQWMLRPGDLVKVDLSDNDSLSGIFVPMDAISYEAEKTYLFVVDESVSPPVVNRVEVKLDETDSRAGTSLRLRVEPVDTSASLDGRKFVSRGAHYLRDGEPVRIVKSEIEKSKPGVAESRE